MVSPLPPLHSRSLTGAQKEGGGPNVFMREALNLVDFFVSNYVTQDVDISTLEVIRKPVDAVRYAVLSV
jgi:hypothetical protein